MSDELNAAMNKIKQVLNHYKAFQEVEKALQVASDAERMVVELGLQADALRKDIAELEAAKATVLADYKVMVDKSEAEHTDRLAAMQADEYKAWEAVHVAEARMEGLRVRFETMEANYGRRANEIGATIAELHAEAEAAEERYRMAKQAIDSLKAGL